jgi:alpha-galactosidase/6-phospho-beta-glucosidase family protein
VIKVAMIGAGSVVFSKNLTGDILSYPEFREARFSYMDIDPERLEVGAALCGKVARTLGAKPVIEATGGLRRALVGADFVINMVQIGQVWVEFHDRRYHRAGGNVSGAADVSDAARAVPADGRGLSAGDSAELLEPDGDEHADDRARGRRRARGGVVP